MFPATDTLLPIGQVLKSYGTDGEIFIRFFNDFVDYFEDREPVFLFYDGLPVPFSISSFNVKGNNKAIVRLDEIDNHEEAEEIAGREIFAPVADRIVYDEDTPEYFIGFTLYDQNDRKVGIIGDVHDFSGNICFELENSETLIPFNEDLVISFDEDTRSITLEISEGLL